VIRWVGVCVGLAAVLAGYGLPAGRVGAAGYDQPVLVAAAEKKAAPPTALVAGPMLGGVTDTSARFWVRTQTEADVTVVVGTGASLASPVRSPAVRTRGDEDFTAVAEVEGLTCDTKYTYDVLVNGKSALAPALPVFRTFPSSAGGAKFVVGFGGGARYKPENERIWDTIRSCMPLAFLFLGDNVYIDKPEDPAEQRLQYYRRQSQPAMRRLGAAAAIYAIWDDHDFGTEHVEGGPAPLQPKWKPEVWRVFRQNWNNPSYGGGEKHFGCWFDFSIADVDFFMTDGRYYRSAADGTMLGPVQKKWLLERLAASTATFKIIASSTPWAEDADGAGDSWQAFRDEREEIFSFIGREKIDGVVLVSGDRHRSDAWKIERPGGYPLYEFTSAKLTSTIAARTDKKALFSYNKGNLFGLLAFDTTPKDPTVTFLVMGINGENVYSLTVKKSEISHASD